MEKVLCRTIYELWYEAEQMPWTIQMMMWWYQDVIDEPEEYTDNLLNLK